VIMNIMLASVTRERGKSACGARSVRARNTSDAFRDGVGSPRDRWAACLVWLGAYLVVEVVRSLTVRFR
jgi:hypothetical protein